VPLVVAVSTSLAEERFSYQNRVAFESARKIQAVILTTGTLTEGKFGD
jgi:cation transport ATPase